MTPLLEQECVLVQEGPRPGHAAANVTRVIELVRAHPTADLIVFPELFVSGYQAEPGTEMSVEELLGAGLADAAREVETGIIVGFAESADGLTYNSVVAIDANGCLAGCYRKIFLFGEGELARFAAGTVPEVVEMGEIRVGLMNCFDMEFPEMARAVVRKKPDLLVTVAANMSPYHENHRIFSMARALESRLPHLYVNQVGTVGPLRFIGGTRSVDDTGWIRAEIVGEEEGTLVVRPELGDAYPDEIGYAQIADRIGDLDPREGGA